MGLFLVCPIWADSSGRKPYGRSITAIEMKSLFPCARICAAKACMLGSCGKGTLHRTRREGTHSHSQFCENYRRFAKGLERSMRQIHRAGGGSCSSTTPAPHLPRRPRRVELHLRLCHAVRDFAHWLVPRHRHCGLWRGAPADRAQQPSCVDCQLTRPAIG